MPNLNVTLKENAPESELEAARAQSKEQGGTITHEWTTLKGFVVEFPPEKVHVLKTNEHIYVEQEQSFDTQGQ